MDHSFHMDLSVYSDGSISVKDLFSHSAIFIRANWTCSILRIENLVIRFIRNNKSAKRNKMALAVRNFAVGQLVYTKIAGYPPWPSCIIDFRNKNSKKNAVVRYFGWNSDV